ncbi:MAG: YbbR-like domain-containing protein [Candidatus Eisenbacteria bacterium]|nr:YbbR-like domain-containing protein [Candidatus Eisenbacteria bacterium]
MIGFVTRNLGWKLLSLALAVLLWLVIVRDPEMTTTINVPVLYRGMPESLVVNSEMIRTVQVEIRGPSRQLTPESVADAMVILDLGNVSRAGDRTYPIEASNVSLPNGVFFSRAVPSQVRIHFENRFSRDVPVKVVFSNLPPEGYDIVEQIVDPPTLPVVGPESNVRALESVDTDSIDASEIVATGEFQVNAFCADPQVSFESPPRVSVTVTVRRVR